MTVSITVVMLMLLFGFGAARSHAGTCIAFYEDPAPACTLPFTPLRRLQESNFALPSLI